MWVCPDTSLLMTRPRALSDLLMAEASFSCCPSESAAFCRSLPAHVLFLALTCLQVAAPGNAKEMWP